MKRLTVRNAHITYGMEYIKNIFVVEFRFDIIYNNIHIHTKITLLFIFRL